MKSTTNTEVLSIGTFKKQLKKTKKELIKNFPELSSMNSCLEYKEKYGNYQDIAFFIDAVIRDLRHAAREFFSAPEFLPNGSLKIDTLTEKFNFHITELCLSLSMWESEKSHYESILNQEKKGIEKIITTQRKKMQIHFKKEEKDLDKAISKYIKNYEIKLKNKGGGKLKKSTKISITENHHKKLKIKQNQTLKNLEIKKTKLFLKEEKKEFVMRELTINKVKILNTTINKIQDTQNSTILNNSLTRNNKLLEKHGKELLKSGNISEGIQFILKAANEGNNSAMFIYGLYLIKRNKAEEGKSWIEQASKNGYIPARNHIGIDLIKSNNTKEAKEIFMEIAEEQKNDDKIFDIIISESEKNEKAQDYFDKGVVLIKTPETKKDGLDFLQKACDLSHPEALFIYGSHLIKMESTKEKKSKNVNNTFKGIFYLYKASILNYSVAKLLLKQILSNEKMKKWITVLKDKNNTEANMIFRYVY